MKTPELTSDRPAPGGDLDARLNVARGIEPAVPREAPVKRMAILLGAGLGSVANQAAILATLMGRGRS